MKHLKKFENFYLAPDVDSDEQDYLDYAKKMREVKPGEEITNPPHTHEEEEEEEFPMNMKPMAREEEEEFEMRPMAHEEEEERGPFHASSDGAYIRYRCGRGNYTCRGRARYQSEYEEVHQEDPQWQCSLSDAGHGCCDCGHDQHFP